MPKPPPPPAPKPPAPPPAETTVNVKVTIDVPVFVCLIAVLQQLVEKVDTLLVQPAQVQTLVNQLDSLGAKIKRDADAAEAAIAGNKVP